MGRGLGWEGGDEEDGTLVMVETGTGLGQGWALVMGMRNGTGMGIQICMGIWMGDWHEHYDSDEDGD